MVHRLILLLVIAAPCWAVDPPPELSTADRAALRQGEVLVQAMHQDERGAAMWAAIRIDASDQAIFNAIVECRRAPEYHENLKECRTLERHDDYDVVRHAVKYLWFVPRQEYIFRADYQGYRQIRFKMLRGDLKQMEGGWDLFPLAEEDAEENRFIVRYFLHVRPGFLVPRWAVRRTMKKTLPQMLAVMKDLSEHPEKLSARGQSAD